MPDPPWLTPARKRLLDKIVIEKRNICLRGHRQCIIFEHFLTPRQRLEFTWIKEPPTRDIRRFDPFGKAQGKKPMYDINLFATTKVVPLMPLVEDQAEKQERILKAEWIAEDRDERGYLQRLESRLPTGEVGRFQQRFTLLPGGMKRGFDPIERERFFEDQPRYYLEDVEKQDLPARLSNLQLLQQERVVIGYDPVQQLRVFKIRVPSTAVRLLIRVPKRLEEEPPRFGKRAFREFRKRGKPLPVVSKGEMQAIALDRAAKEGIRAFWDYWNSVRRQQPAGSDVLAAIQGGDTAPRQPSRKGKVIFRGRIGQ